MKYGTLGVFLWGMVWACSLVPADCSLPGNHFWQPVAPSNNYVQCVRGAYYNGSECACESPNDELKVDCFEDNLGIKQRRFSCRPRTTICEFDTTFNDYHLLASSTRYVRRYVRCIDGAYWDESKQACVLEDPERSELHKVCHTKRKALVAGRSKPRIIEQVMWAARAREAKK